MTAGAVFVKCNLSSTDSACDRQVSALSAEPNLAFSSQQFPLSKRLAIIALPYSTGARAVGFSIAP